MDRTRALITFAVSHSCLIDPNSFVLWKTPRMWCPVFRWVSPHLCCNHLAPVCVSPVDSVIPTRLRPLCVLLTGVCRAPPFRDILSSLSCRVVHLSFALAFAPTKLAFALAFVLFAFALAGLDFGFVVGGRPSSMFVSQVFGFHSTVSRPVSVNSTP